MARFLPRSHAEIAEGGTSATVRLRHGSPRVTYEPPAWLRKSDKAKAWFEECTEIIRAELGNSNFYSEAHEWLDILTGFGPAAIAYSSRIALAIKQIENVGLLQTLQMIEPLLPLDPSLLDRFDFDTAIPDLARNNGTPARWIRDDDAVTAIRQARAQAQQRMQQLQEAQMGSEAAKNLGSVKKDSLVAKTAQAA